jgi:hypothetical protein
LVRWNVSEGIGIGILRELESNSISVWLAGNGIGIQFHSLFGSQTCQMNLISEMQNDRIALLPFFAFLGIF